MKSYHTKNTYGDTVIYYVKDEFILLSEEEQEKQHKNYLLDRGGHGPNVIIFCKQGSYIEQFASYNSFGEPVFNRLNGPAHITYNTIGNVIDEMYYINGQRFSRGDYEEAVANFEMIK